MKDSPKQKNLEDTHKVLPETISRKEKEDLAASLRISGVLLMNDSDNEELKSSIEKMLKLKKSLTTKIETGKEYREALKKRKTRIALELIKRKEKFVFPGIKGDSYAILKTEEIEDFARSGYAFTLIDEVLKEMEQDGIKIGLSNNQRDIYVMPAESDDHKSSTLPLKHLIIHDPSDPSLPLQLKRLLLLDKMLRESYETY